MLCTIQLLTSGLAGRGNLRLLADLTTTALPPIGQTYYTLWSRPGRRFERAGRQQESLIQNSTLGCIRGRSQGFRGEVRDANFGSDMKNIKYEQSGK